MKKILSRSLFAAACFSISVFAQIPVNVLVDISKAEDELRFDGTVEKLLKNRDPRVRSRAALAAGRIGNDEAINALAKLLDADKDPNVRAIAAFAIGEIESINGSDAILKVIYDKRIPHVIRARAVEAAGKIAAANPKDERAKELGKAILEALENEDRRGPKIQSKQTVLLGITAALRAKPANNDLVLAKFLTNPDGRIRTDAANALGRLRAKNANEKFRAMLRTDLDPNARANAARALGAAEDSGSVGLLTTASVADKDSRVRVSAIRALGALKNPESGERLTEHGEKLLAASVKSEADHPSERNELLEIATALGRIFANSKNDRAAKLLDSLRTKDDYSSPETEIALARILAGDYIEPLFNFGELAVDFNWRRSSSTFQGLTEAASIEGNPEDKDRIRKALLEMITDWRESDSKQDYPKNADLAIPDLLKAYAALKPANVSEIFRSMLANEPDIFIRTALAEILADQPPSKENVDALKAAFESSLKTDKLYNDAQLAILSALVKLDKKASFESLRLALKSTDYVVRRHAANLIKQDDLTKDFANVERIVGTAKVYDPKTGTRLGQVLNKTADYSRAVSRKNGTVKAVLTTGKGKFTIELFPEDAPLTVDNFIKLARSGYFNGVEIHRVVPNFVMQDGDPRGDGNGGPGWSMRCEVNTLPYERGAVGMALSGKDTGGSQWFVTHSPQPHLDGGYTVFGKVNETGLKIVDMLVRGDKILKVEILENTRK